MNRIIYKDSKVTIFQSALYQTNSTVIETDDVILVIDPCWLPDEVQAIRNYVDSIKKNRPIFLIFTHSDYDHIMGYRAFKAEKVIISEGFSKNPEREKVIHDMEKFDHDFYINRTYPLEYPTGDFIIFRDGIQFRYGKTRLAFYLTPGHTHDSMMVVVWQMGILIAGDYLSDIEFPFIKDSVAYIETMEKLTRMHDRNWFTRVIPGHGSPTFEMSDWLMRRQESLEYIYELRGSIATDAKFDEKALWEKYKFPKHQREFHQSNTAVMTKEYEEGKWTWEG